jgi:hypothetical protein
MSLEDEDPSSQLHIELLSSIPHLTRRPILTHLNADTTWLLSLPIPEKHLSASQSKRLYYHILFDPWLTGPQSDVAAFFSTQWHAEPSSCQTIEDVEGVIRGIEAGASIKPRPSLGKSETEEVIIVDTTTTHDEEGERQGEVEGEGDETWIDAVIISHEFTDHMHAPTLLTLPPSTPVFATTKAYSAIKSWKHFHTVREIRRFTGDW